MHWFGWLGGLFGGLFGGLVGLFRGFGLFVVFANELGKMGFRCG